MKDLIIEPHVWQYSRKPGYHDTGVTAADGDASESTRTPSFMAPSKTHDGCLIRALRVQDTDRKKRSRRVPLTRRVPPKVPAQDLTVIGGSLGERTGGKISAKLVLAYAEADFLMVT
jgi:hypothetical protein